MNYTPVKYGLVDGVQKPGHNVTGVYQTGYYKESLTLLKTLVPEAKTFVILADKTPTGRSHLKKIEYLNSRGDLPIKLVETVTTFDYGNWKRKAQELQKKVDAFFLAQYSGLKNRQNKYVPS